MTSDWIRRPGNFGQCRPSSSLSKKCESDPPMDEPTVRVLVLADFNAANFAAHLTHDTTEPPVVATAGTLGDVGADPSVSGESADRAGSDAGHDVAIVWTRPEAISTALAGLVDHGVAVLADVMRDVDEFVARLARLRGQYARVVVMTWRVPRVSGAFGAIAMKEGMGLANVVMRMNLRLAERVD